MYVSLLTQNKVNTYKLRGPPCLMIKEEQKMSNKPAIYKSEEEWEEFEEEEFEEWEEE